MTYNVFGGTLSLTQSILSYLWNAWTYFNDLISYHKTSNKCPGIYQNTGFGAPGVC